VEVDYWIVLLIVVLVLLVLVVGAAVALKMTGALFVGTALFVVVIYAVVASAVAAWPLAHVIIAIIYATRTDPVSPSTDYSGMQAHDAGEGDERSGSSMAPPQN
jgi:hypothetical protein